METNSIERLRTFLADLPPGPVPQNAIDALTGLLTTCWGQFEGAADSKMAAYKLKDRIKNVSWNPPELAFVVARHGGTVLGSTRAERQRWTVDVAKLIARPSDDGFEQVSPRALPIDVDSIVQDIIKRVQRGPQEGDKTDNGIVWNGADRVAVVLVRVLPRNGFKRTLAGRTRRLGKILVDSLSQLGWHRDPSKRTRYEFVKRRLKN